MTTLPDTGPRCNVAAGGGIPDDLAPDRIEAQAERSAPLDCLYGASIMLAVYRCAYKQLHQEAQRQIAGLKAELAARNPLDCGRCDDVLVWQDPAPMTSEAYRRLIREV
jgi:hypothetical protein